MNRLAIAALTLPLLSSCTIVTQTFGIVDLHAPEAPRIADAVTLTPERTPQLHYTACLELSIDNPACPRNADVFADDPNVGTPLSFDHCAEQPVETSEAGCERLAVP